MSEPLPNLFNLTKNIYTWYWEKTYETTEEKIINDLKEYNEKYLTKEEDFISVFENFNLYKETGVALWRTFRLLEEAEPFLKKINQKDPTDTAILFYLGEIALEKKEYQNAISYFNHYINIHPTHIPIINNAPKDDRNVPLDNNYLLNLWFIYLHRYDPNTIEAYTYLGDIYSILGNNEKAIYYYNEGIKTAPTHHLAPYVSLAEFLKKKNEKLNLIIKLYEKKIKNKIALNNI